MSHNYKTAKITVVCQNLE